MALTIGCGWVNSAGEVPVSFDEAIERQILTGSGDIVDIVAEEPVQLDTRALLSRNRDTASTVPVNTIWQQIGNSDLSACPHLSVQPGTGVSLRQACNLAAYAANDSHTAADCSIHFVELIESPGVYEVNAPAITHPVVLHFNLTATSSDGLTSKSELTICLEP